MVDFTTIMTAGKAVAELKALIEKFGKNRPDAVAALSLVSRLQEQIDGLRAQVLELQTENLELKRKNDEDEIWRARTAALELFTTPGGAVVHARRGKPPYFCAVCYEKRQLIPLQLRGAVADCHGCKSIFDHIQPRDLSKFGVLQRRLPGGTAHF